MYDADGLEDTDDVTVYVLDPSFDDTSPPELTLLGLPSVSVIQGTQYIEAGATAFDSHDGNLTGSILTNASQLVLHTVGSYNISYTVSDVGNQSIGRDDNGNL